MTKTITINGKGRIRLRKTCRSVKKIASSAVLTAGLVAGSVVTAPGTAAALTDNGSVQRGDSNSESVGALQRALRSEGYDIDVDFSFGEATEAVLASWQRSQGLTPDALAGRTVFAELGIADAHPTSAQNLREIASSRSVTSMSRDEIRQLQRDLNRAIDLGVFDGRRLVEDGIWGRNVSITTGQFQASQPELALDMIPGNITLASLAHAIGSSGRHGTADSTTRSPAAVTTNTGSNCGARAQTFTEHIERGETTMAVAVDATYLVACGYNHIELEVGDEIRILGENDLFYQIAVPGHGTYNTARTAWIPKRYRNGFSDVSTIGDVGYEIGEVGDALTLQTESGDFVSVAGADDFASAATLAAFEEQLNHLASETSHSNVSYEVVQSGIDRGTVKLYIRRPNAQIDIIEDTFGPRVAASATSQLRYVRNLKRGFAVVGFTVDFYNSYEVYEGEGIVGRVAKAGARAGTITLVGVGTAAAGGAATGAICGPGAPVCSVVGAVVTVGAAIATTSATEHLWDDIFLD